MWRNYPIKQYVQKKWVLVIGLCLLLMVSGYIIFQKSPNSNGVSHQPNQKILYWIDPMEPQIPYEGPGKSRMNMDLVPVYAEDPNHSGSASSTITISPAIIHNLGVRTAMVEEGTLQPKIRAYGIIKANENKIVHIHSYAEGWIRKLHTKESQELIEKNQPLFEIYSPELRVAQYEYLLQSTGKKGGVGEASLDKLRALGISEPQIEQLRTTKKENPLVTVYAPQQGYIDSLNVREGMWINPEITLMSLTDLSEVWVVAEFFSIQLDLIKIGQEVKVFFPHSPNQVWQGQIDYIYPEIDPISLTAKARIRLPNNHLLLKPNQYVAVEIKAFPKVTLKIPREAVIWGEGKQHVILALGEGKFQPKTVVTGMEDESHIEIISGLNKEEQVVTSAQFLIDSEINLKSALLRLDSQGS